MIMRIIFWVFWFVALVGTLVYPDAVTPSTLICLFGLHYYSGGLDADN